MQESVYGFVVEPIGERYNNKRKVGDKELVLNTEIFNHQFVNRLAKVISVPRIGETDIKPGDEIIIHHNVFRRWHDVTGKERNSKNYFNEQTYIIFQDQIFLYKRNGKWNSPKGYCFVKPIESNDELSVSKTKAEKGVVVYTDGTVKKGDVVGFKPGGEYEFVIEGELYYRIISNLITINYGHKRNEKEYNPSWAKSS